MIHQYYHCSVNILKGLRTPLGRRLLYSTSSSNQQHRNNHNNNNNNNNVHLTFYTRPTCSLCIDAKEILYPICEEVNENKENLHLGRKIVIDEIDIDLPQNQQHYDRWKYDVPVAMINNKLVFKHRIVDEDKLFFDLDQYLNKGNRDNSDSSNSKDS